MLTRESSATSRSRSASRVGTHTIRAALLALRDPLLWRELAPMSLAVALLPWLGVCSRHYANGVVWRDTTMLNYASWCMLHGERIYDTVVTHDGPLCWIVHALYLLLGGMKDDGWRHVDLYFHVIAGATLGGLLAPTAARYDFFRKLTWASVGAALWLSALFVYDWPASTQRQPIYAAMGLAGIALVYRSADQPARRARWMLLVAALLCGWVFWGKQTEIVYLAAAGLTALLLPVSPSQPRAWRVRWLALGVLAATVSVFVFVAAVGSLRGMWFWYFRYNLVVHRFHDLVRYQEIWAVEYGREPFIVAGLVLTGGVAALVTRALPLRAAGLIVAPALMAYSAVAQHRGWRYHFAPVDFCAAAFFVFVLAQVWCTTEADEVRRLVRNGAVVTVTMFIGWWSMKGLLAAPWLKRSEMHLGDAAVTEPMAAAAVLIEHTKPGDRVFNFGDDPRVLLAAERLPATPYIVPWLIDVMRHIPTGGDLAVTPMQEARARIMQADLEQDACTRLLADPPAAIVTRDDAVGYSYKDSPPQVTALYGFCPALSDVVARRYHDTPAGPFHVFLRDDRP